MRALAALLISIHVPVWTPGGANFQATVDQAPARILAVRGPSSDLMLLVVLDLAGDLAWVEPAKAALAATLSAAPPRVYTGLLHAQDGLKVLADPTRDHARLRQIIQGVASSGKAGLLDTLEPAGAVADAVLAKSAVRVAVWYITDSDVHNYREDFLNPVINSSDSHDLSRRFPEALIQERIAALDARLASLETPFFVLHLNARSGRLPEAYQNGLKQLAETSGGTAAFCRSIAEISEAASTMFERIVTHYSLLVELPEHPPKMVEVGIESPGGAAGRTRFTLRGR